jgi:hypothetical protein
MPFFGDVGDNLSIVLLPNLLVLIASPEDDLLKDQQRALC